jgi:hypothetical protein
MWNLQIGKVNLGGTLRGEGARQAHQIKSLVKYKGRTKFQVMRVRVVSIHIFMKPNSTVFPNQVGVDVGRPGVSVFADHPPSHHVDMRHHLPDAPKDMLRRVVASETERAAFLPREIEDEKLSRSRSCLS